MPMAYAAVCGDVWMSVCLGRGSTDQTQGRPRVAPAPEGRVLISGVSDPRLTSEGPPGLSRPRAGASIPTARREERFSPPGGHGDP